MIDREQDDLQKAAWDIGVNASQWDVPGVTAWDLDGDHPFWQATHLQTDRRVPGSRKVAFFETTWAGIWVRADRFICRAHPHYSTICGVRMLDGNTLEIQVRLGIGRSDDEMPEVMAMPDGYLNRAARRALCWPGNSSNDIQRRNAA